MTVDEIVTQMRQSPHNLDFKDLVKVCRAKFGEPRQVGSHVIFKTPWAGDPRINIQNANGKAKIYQVKQVLLAVDKLENLTHED
jgi:hypothetical protein